MLPSMDIQVALRRGLRRGLLMLLRDRKSGMTFVALLSVVLLLQFLLLAFLGVRGVSTLLVTNGDLRIEVLPSAVDRDVQQLYAALRELPYVHSVVYIPKENAYERERERDPELIAFLEKFKLQNPFPDTFSLTLVTLRHYGALRSFLERPDWKSVVHPSFLSTVRGQEQRVRGLLQVTRSVGVLTGFFLLLSVSVLLLVLVELVERRSQRRAREVELEELLGASATDTVAPFVTEMTAFLLVALVVASLIALVAYAVLPWFSSAFAQGSFLALRRELTHLLWAFGLPLLFLEILLVPVLATGGVLLGLRLHR